MKYIIINLWNQKRKYMWVLIEQALVFLILLLCVTTLSKTIEQYNSPGLLDVENVLVFGYSLGDNKGVSRDNIKKISRKMNTIINNLKEKPYIKAISKSTEFILHMKLSFFYFYK